MPAHQFLQGFIHGLRLGFGSGRSPGLCQHALIKHKILAFHVFIIPADCTREITHATAMTTTAPITLYQRYATAVNFAIAKTVACPATTPQNAAAPPTRFMKNAAKNTPSM